MVYFAPEKQIDLIIVLLRNTALSINSFTAWVPAFAIEHSGD